MSIDDPDQFEGWIVRPTKEVAMSVTQPIPFPERDSDELLTLSEVAEILRVPVNTLRWWRQTGTGPEFFKMGRRLVTTVGDVRRYIREQRRANGPAAAATRMPHRA